MSLLGAAEATVESVVPGGYLLPLVLKLLPWALLAGVGALALHFDERAVANAEALRTQAAQFKQAQADADAAWAAKLSEIKTEQAKDAANAQSAYQQVFGTVQSLSSVYAVSHPATLVLSPPSASGGSPAKGAAPPPGAGVLAGVSTDPFVAVTKSDLQACSNDALYALKAHDWALSVGDTSTPAP